MKTKILFSMLALICSISTWAQSSCSSTITATQGANGLVTFTATPAVPSSSQQFYWNFGSPNSGAYGQTATYTFTNNGMFQVCLTVSDSNNGGSCTITICDTINVTNAVNSSANCSATFSSTMINNTTIQFTAVPAVNTTTKTYTWNFGNGTTGTGVSPMASYPSGTGTYTVCVTVHDGIAPNTCTNTYCDSIVLGGTNPTSGCTASYVIVPDTSAGASPHTYIGYNNSVGTNLTYVWLWGDGTSSSGAYPSHTYASAGNYMVCLAISGVNCVDSFCAPQGINKTLSAPYTITFKNPTATGIDNIDIKNMELYPNPASDKFYISNDASTTWAVNIYDISGKKVKTQSVKPSEAVNISSLLNGIYFTTATNEKGNIIHGKFSKLK